jgi:hypothetical protein
MRSMRFATGPVWELAHRNSDRDVPTLWAFPKRSESEGRTLGYGPCAGWMPKVSLGLQVVIAGSIFGLLRGNNLLTHFHN